MVNAFLQILVEPNKVKYDMKTMYIRLSRIQLFVISVKHARCPNSLPTKHIYKYIYPSHCLLIEFATKAPPVTCIHYLVYVINI